jgi:hypothetical protein
LSVLGGVTRPSLSKRKKVLGALGAALVLVGAGCGEGGGVTAGATVAAYVEAPLCRGAKGELARKGAHAGSVEIRLVCLAGTDDAKRTALAIVGANARRATEDSSTVAYLEPLVTPSFSRPIVEAASIPVVRDSSGAIAMDRLLGAIQDASSGSLRDSIREDLAPPHSR